MGVKNKSSRKESKYNTKLIKVAVGAVISTVLFSNIDDSMEDFQQVTVKKGDTVWDMAERFDDSKMSKIEFVSWVQENNDLHITQLKEGQTIVIPVKKNIETTDMLHLADSEK